MSVPDNIRALVYALHKLGGGEVTRGQAGIRINLSALNVASDAPWENCFTVDIPADRAAEIVELLNGPTLNPRLVADIEDHFDQVDPESYLADVFGSQDAEASLAAYEQLVTGEYDGEL